MARRREPTEFIELYGKLKRCLNAVATQAYAQLDLGTTQGKFLRQIGRNSRISQAELARATSTDPTLTGRVLQTLIERGWVRRQRSDEDRREYVLELTAAGRRAEERVETVRTEMAEKLMGVLDERDVEDFERITHKILAAYDTSGEREAGAG